MRVNSLFLVALALPLYSAVTTASTIADLSAVQSETIMYEARAKRAEAKAKMQESSAKAGDDPLLNQASGAPSIVASDLPTITGVSGAGGRLLATVCFANGTTIRSKAGQAIPGGLVLTEITLDRVMAAKGERTVALQFVPACNPTPASSTAPLPGQMSPFRPPVLPSR